MNFRARQGSTAERGPLAKGGEMYRQVCTRIRVGVWGPSWGPSRYRAGRRSSILTSLPVVPLSWHCSTVRIRVSASVRTPKPAPPITTPTFGAGRSSTILHRLVVGCTQHTARIKKAPPAGGAKGFILMHRRIPDRLHARPRRGALPPWCQKIGNVVGRGMTTAVLSSAAGALSAKSGSFQGGSGTARVRRWLAGRRRRSWGWRSDSCEEIQEA